MAEIISVDSSFRPELFEELSCAFGVFDGVHRGHQFLISEAKATAAAHGKRSAAVTFDIDPDEIFNAQRLKKLMSNADRLEALAATGVDYVIAFPFTREFAAQSPVDFLEHSFGGYAPFALHTGDDFRFGSRASGTVSTMRHWGEQRGTLVCPHHLASDDGLPITATRIRGHLSRGEVARANELLGHPYTFKSEVVPGRHEGADMGFATANLSLPAMMQTLGEGVYAAYVTVDGTRWTCAMSMGVAPTFADATATCEAHILDFSGEIYGSTIVVEPVEYLRPMIKFDSVEELIATVKGNIQWVRDNL